MLAMSTVSSAEAAATSSSTAANAPRFQFLRNIYHIARVSSPPITERFAKLQLAASGPLQFDEDSSVTSTEPQGLTTNPSPATSTAATEIAVTAQNGRPIEIPYPCRSIYIFLDAVTSISQAHRERFPALKDIFQRNIEENRKLCKLTTYITYDLRMCGSCLADAIPSIVVFCPRKKWKKIESLLTQPHIKSQFEPDTATSTFVRFGLVFWAKPIEVLAFHEVAVVLPEKQDTASIAGDATIGLAPWGLHITDREKGNKSTTTLSCIVQVAGVRFGLTTAHAFQNPWTTSSGTDDINSDDSDTDDEEHSTTAERYHCGEASTDFHPTPPVNSNEQEVQLGNSQVYIPPHEDTSAWVQGHANLDWALLDLGLEVAGMSTHATTAEALSIADRLPQQCLDVLIITRAHLNIPAKLYNIPSYIGGVKGSQAAEVWTVGCVPENTPLRKGDSGSIVLDAESGELYGMVLAVNPFGDIYIAPFAAILAQVKELFETQDAFVFNLPHHPRPFTVSPGLEANKAMEEHTTPWVYVHEGSEPTPEAGHLTLHQSDLEELGWRPSYILERPLPLRFRERTAILSTDSKVESVNGTASGLTFSALEDVPDDTQRHTSAEYRHLLTRTNLSSQNVPGLIRDIQAWIDGDMEWLRIGVGVNQATVLSFHRASTCHISDSTIDFDFIPAHPGQPTSFGSDASVFIPAQPSSFGRDAFAVGALFDDVLYDSIYDPDLELDEILGPAVRADQSTSRQSLNNASRFEERGGQERRNPRDTTQRPSVGGSPMLQRFLWGTA